jgi:hypothetical protein
MKRGFFTSIAVVLLFTACRKEEMAASLATTPANNTSSAPIVSNWEGVPSNSWMASRDANGATYSYQRTMPQLGTNVMSDGLVAVYSKGYSFGEIAGNNPMAMPFLFYNNEQQTIPYAWEFKRGMNKIDVMVKMGVSQEDMFLQNQNGIQFRYIVIPREFLIKNNLSDVAVAKMSYRQLADLLQFTL